MFDRNNGGARVGARMGGRVGQNVPGIPGAMVPGPVGSASVPFFGCQPAAVCQATGVRRTMLGADSTPAGAPYAPTTIPGIGGSPLTNNTTAAAAAAGTGIMWTFTPRCPAKARAIYLSAGTISTGVEILGLYIGAQGANGGQNLLAMNGAAVGSIPGDAFGDLNACVPLMDIDQCANFTCPFILVGRTTAAVAAMTTAYLGAALIIDLC